jgi:polar amino acid transport system substrate-binding protein
MNNGIIRKSIISFAILMGLSATALAQDCKPKHEF